MNINLLNRCTTLAVQNRSFSTTLVNNLIQSWRKQRGLPLNPNSSGPLTDKPDYTFLDGRPTPLGMRQKRRMMKERDIAEKIIQLSKEIDYAVVRHENIEKIKETERKNLLANKLQRKGYLLAKGK